MSKYYLSGLEVMLMQEVLFLSNIQRLKEEGQICNLNGNTEENPQRIRSSTYKT